MNPMPTEPSPHIESVQSVPSDAPGIPQAAEKGRVHFRVPFAVVLALLVLVALVIPVSVGMALTALDANQMLVEGAQVQHQIMLNATSSTVRLMLSETEKAVAELRLLIEMNTTAPDDPLALLRTMSAAMASRLDTCGAVAFTTPSGGTTAIAQLPGGGFNGLMTFPNNTLCQFLVGNATQPSAFFDLRHPLWCLDQESTAPIVPSTAPYLAVNTTSRTGGCWTHVYVANPRFMSSRPIRLTRSEPVFVNNAFAGVVYMSGYADALGAVFSREATVSGGVAFVAEQESGCFLGSTSEAVRSEPGQTSCQLVEDVQDELIARAARTVTHLFGQWTEVPRRATFWMGSHLVDVAQIDGPCACGVHWTVVICSTPAIVPLKPATLSTVLAITALLLVGSVVLSIVVTLPLKQISRDMSNIITLNFASLPRSNLSSSITEIHEMQRCYVALRRGTKALTKFVPAPVVLKLMNSGAATNQIDVDPRGIEVAPMAVLFTDIVGFTTLSEQLSHAQLLCLLSNWFSHFGAVIQAHRGTIDKFIGDCIMALYGKPVPIEQSRIAQEACQTALDFAEANAEANQSADLNGLPHVQYRVGLHFGDVIVGNLGYEGRVNYTVCGNAVNIASRMEQLGKDYEITPLVSDMQGFFG
eukprot:m51a1_g7214 putative adenylate cyclase (643) ;mRNA; r:231623-233708